MLGACGEREFGFRAGEAYSGHQSDGPVGVEQRIGARPAVELRTVPLPGPVHDARQGVPERPWAPRRQGPSQAELLEPAHAAVGEAHDGEPDAVGADVGEGEALGRSP